jgi:hypothetical protein
MICTTKADSLKNNANNFIKIWMGHTQLAQGRVSDLGTSSAEWFALDETSRKVRSLMVASGEPIVDILNLLLLGILKCEVAKRSAESLHGHQ